MMLDEIKEQVAKLAKDDSSSSLERLKQLLMGLYDDAEEKHVFPRIITRALLRKGDAGIQIMRDSILDVPHFATRVAIIETLISASIGKTPPLHLISDATLDPVLNQAPNAETVRYCTEALHDLIIESQQDNTLSSALSMFMFESDMLVEDRSEATDLRRLIFDVYAESSIKITKRLITEFEGLVNGQYPEEEYQQFLREHPVFIDPLAAEVIPKQKLGVEYITDFIVRRLDSDYVVVEIEKPQDLIFSKANDLTADFTHAFGQIIDFQEWVSTHAEYARSLLPGIHVPRGLLIMGRSSDLTDRMVSKLDWFSANSKNIEILTYDDLIARAKNLYSNIHRIPRL